MPDREQVLTVGPLLTGHYRWQTRGRRITPGRHTPETLYRPDGSDDWHLILTLRGRGVAGTLTPRHPAMPRRALLWRPGVPQCYLTAPEARGWERLWVHVRPPAAWLPHLAWPELEPGLAAVDLDAATCRLVRAALSECLAHDHGGEADRLAFAMNSLERAVLHIAHAAGGAAGPGDPRIATLVERIAADLAAEWSLPAMAAAAGVSVPQLVRLCARHLGETPHRLLERLRLDEAGRRLESGAEPVAAIAAALGFADLSHFTRRFRRRFTITPALWRRGRRSGELEVKPDLEHLRR